MIFKHVHKWAALAVFTQLLIWLVSGFLLGKLDHSVAAGHSTQQQSQRIEQRNIKPTFSVQQALVQYPTTVGIELTYLHGKPVYRLIQSKQYHQYQLSDYLMIDALTGEPFELDNQLAQQIAMASYQGQASVNSAQLMQPPIDEISRERNAVWQVSVDDPLNTNIYIRANDARVLSHVNDETRWRDLLLMLHFMDYTQTGSFNNVFIQIMALATLLLAGTGFWWGIRLIMDNQIRLSWFSSKQKLSVTILNRNDEQELKVKKQSSLLSALSDHDIEIESICGGGGVCGRCRFLATQQTSILPADKQHLTKAELQLGYRLACQHSSHEVTDIAVKVSDTTTKPFPSA